MRILLAGAILLCSAASAAGATVTLTWSPNPEPDIAGYVVSYGTSSGQYPVSIDIGNQTSFQFAEPDPTIRYYLTVRAYNLAGLHSEFSPEVSTDPAGTITLTGVTSSVPAPQALGTSVTFTATAIGGVAPTQYKWLISDGSAWQTQQNWSTSNTFTWKATTANANYRVGAWARGATSTADSPESPSSAYYIPFPIMQPLALTSLSANLASPQMTGTSITVTASATGGIAPYQYKWLISDGNAWSVAQNWSASNTFAWTPTIANANYSVGVWARSATSTIDAAENSNAGSSISFAITAAAGTIAVTSLTANKPAPQLSGSKIMFSATATGASAHQFKWWVFDGVTWAIAQEWSSSNKFMWTPAAANSNYQVLVRAQDRSNPAESAGASMPFPIAPTSGNGRGNGNGK